jgi:hypothetical protein
MLAPKIVHAFDHASRHLHRISFLHRQSEDAIEFTFFAPPIVTEVNALVDAFDLKPQGTLDSALPRTRR